VQTLQNILLILFSTLAEKNPLRQKETPGLIVISASRVVVVVLVVVWTICALRQPELLSGWPFAMLGVVLSIALPVTGALQRSTAAEILEYGKTIVERLGGGSSH
jgi:hypothetical protein